MNNMQASQPPQRPRPSKKPQGQKRLSPESAFIGYLVLGFGVLAVIAVGLLLMGHFTGGGPKEGGNNTPLSQAGIPQADPAVTRDETIRSLQRDLQAMPQSPAPQPEEPALAFTRGDRLNPSRLNGNWQTVIGDRLTVMQLDNGVFQIILAHADPTIPRLYSSGTYTVLDDMVVLEPRLDWPPPKTPDASRIRYDRLTAGSYPLIVGFKGRQMLWQPVPFTENRVYVPLRNPLFIDTDQRFIAWDRL